MHKAISGGGEGFHWTSLVGRARYALFPDYGALIGTGH